MAEATPTLVGIPWDANSSFMRGAAAAPPLVRQALFSPASNMWSELRVDLGAPGRFADAGDLSLPDSADAVALIESAVCRLVDEGHVPLAIGGDHAVTYPVLRAIGRRHPGLTILHIDSGGGPIRQVPASGSASHSGSSPVAGGCRRSSRRGRPTGSCSAFSTHAARACIT